MKRIIALALCLCLACSVAFAEYLYDQPNQLIGIRAGWTWSSYKQAETETKSQAIDAGVDFVRYLTSSGNLGVSAGIGLEALQHSSGTPVAYRGNIGLAYRRFLSSDSWFSCTAGGFVQLLDQQWVYGPMADAGFVFETNQDIGVCAGCTLRALLGGSTSLQGISATPYMMATFRF
jgi:hypothetical protein